jgi:hypothetical protein
VYFTYGSRFFAECCRFRGQTQLALAVCIAGEHCIAMHRIARFCALSRQAIRQVTGGRFAIGAVARCASTAGTSFHKLNRKRLLIGKSPGNGYTKFDAVPTRFSTGAVRLCGGSARVPLSCIADLQCFIISGLRTGNRAVCHLGQFNSSHKLQDNSHNFARSRLQQQVRTEQLLQVT